MDDILRRLGIVESSATETREDVIAMKAAFTLLATKADVNELRPDVSAIKATLSHLATKAELNDLKAELKSDISSIETRVIRWIVGTTIAVASVSFTIAKFVN